MTSYIGVNINFISN